MTCPGEDNDEEESDPTALIGHRVPQPFPGRWLVDYSQIVLFLESLGMHSEQTLQTLDDKLHHKVLHSIGYLTISIMERIINIQAERNERNDMDDDLPPVLPHELVKLLTSDFRKKIVDIHLQQLRHYWSERTIAEIEIQHRQLSITYRQKLALKSAPDKYSEEVSIKFVRYSMGYCGRSI
jgi:hypothetical protein